MQTLSVPDSYSNPWTEQILLHWRKVATTCNLSPNMVADAEIHEWLDVVADNLALSLSSFVLSDKLETKKVVREVTVPETWWQHTKMVHFPTFSKWMRRPPRMRTHTLTVDVENEVAFPQAKVRYPRELGKPVRLQTFNVDFSLSP